MGAISDHLTESSILLYPKASTKNELLRLMVSTLSNEGVVRDEDLLLKDIKTREKLMPTGVCEFCAIPHTHSDAVLRTAIAVAILKKGLDFSSPDYKPSQLIFLLVGPKAETSLHLKLISRIARLLHDKEFISSLLKAELASEVLHIISGAEA